MKAPRDVPGETQHRIDESQVENILRIRAARSPRPHGEIAVVDQGELACPATKPALNAQPRMDLARGTERRNLALVRLEDNMFSRLHAR